MCRGLGTLAAVVAALVLSAPADAHTLETILQDDAQFLHRPEPQLRRSLEELRLLGVDRIRVTAGWSVLTRDPDGEKQPAFDARNPAAYEQERWRSLDRLLILADEYGFKTMVDVAFFAPKWASSDSAGERGRTNVDSARYSEFAAAVARRYSGTFIIPRADSTAPPPVAGSDERYLEEQYGSTNHDGVFSLHDLLGSLYLFGSDHGDQRVDDTLGTDGRLPVRPLPKVELFTLWNEPNHPGFLRPQWVREDGRARPRSPHVYRRMVARAYPAIKEFRPDATVLIGGTAFDGGTPGSGMGGVPPLRFLRAMACVDKRLRPVRDGSCRGFQRIPGDGWAHHPYSMRTRPGARNPLDRPDQVPVAELDKLARTLDRLIARRRLAPGARQLWVTEYGYETSPPVDYVPWTAGDLAQFLPWAEYLTWQVPSTRSFAQFLLRDLPPGAFRLNKSRTRGFGQWHSGLQYANGTPKGFAPEAFRAGLVAEHRPDGRLALWIRLRLGAGERTFVVETRRPGRRWQALRTMPPGGSAPYLTFKASGAGVVQRYARSPDRSVRHYRLRYSDGRGWHTTPAVRSIN